MNVMPLVSAATTRTQLRTYNKKSTLCRAMKYGDYYSGMAKVKCITDITRKGHAHTVM